MSKYYIWDYVVRVNSMECVTANVHAAVMQMLLEIVTGKCVKSNEHWLFCVNVFNYSAFNIFYCQ